MQSILDVFSLIFIIFRVILVLIFSAKIREQDLHPGCSVTAARVLWEDLVRVQISAARLIVESPLSSMDRAAAF